MPWVKKNDLDYSENDLEYPKHGPDHPNQYHTYHQNLSHEVTYAYWA